MAMTVLPSFQAFLESTNSPQPRSPLMEQPEASPQSAAFFPSACAWQTAAQQLQSQSPMYQASFVTSPSASESEDDDAVMNANGGILPHCGAKRSLPGCGSPRLLKRSGSGELSPTAAAGKRVKKKYLKECERCEIVRRVRAGEKQAHLAKEFGVSRAAVCYLLKHQVEIMRRSSQRL